MARSRDSFWKLTCPDPLFQRPGGYHWLVAGASLVDKSSAEEFWKAWRKGIKNNSKHAFSLSLIVVHAWNVPGPLWSTRPQITPLPVEFCREHGRARSHLTTTLCSPDSLLRSSLALNNLLEVRRGT